MKHRWLYLTVLSILWAFLSLVLGAQRAYASTIFVKPDGNAGNAGASWASATTLQHALSLAVQDDQIWVASGLYYPGVTASDTFPLVTGVAVYGGFAATETLVTQRDWLANPTVLSGDIDGNDATDAHGIVTDTANIIGTNSLHVVTADGTGAPITDNTRLDGFTITAGQALTARGGGMVCSGMLAKTCNPHIENVVFIGNRAQLGGAFYSGGYGGESSPAFVNVTFTHNRADYGGALYNDGIIGESSPSLTHVTFINNTASQDGGALYNDGGFNGISNPTLTHVTFISNTAASNGGAIFNKGETGDSSPTLTDITFISNTAVTYGGAILNNGGLHGVSSPTLVNITFTHNSAGIGGALYNVGYLGVSSPSLTHVTFISNTANQDGGALYNLGSLGVSSPRLVNVLFWDNTAANMGGAVFNNGNTNGHSSPSLINVTFYNNHASSDGGAVYSTADTDGSSVVAYTNVILWENQAGSGNGSEIYNYFAGSAITTTLVQGGITGPGITNDGIDNIIDGGGNLDADPLFVDAPQGNLRLTAASPAIDAGANSAIAVSTDLDGNPRKRDGDGDGSVIVDMGVYEFKLFAPLTVTVTGSGSGQVAVSPAGSACSVPCRGIYAVGTSVTLTATAAIASSFAGWSGACSGLTNPCILSIDAASQVTALFNVSTFTLAVNTDGGGTVTKSPDQSTYLSGTVVTLTPHADSGFSFSEWSGDCSGSGACQLTMNSNKSVSAAFTANPPPSFTLTVNPDDGGTVTKSPEQSTYLSGTVVTLTPHANSGFSFSEWSGDCSGSGACQLTMNSNKSVSAAFTANPPPSFTLTVNPDDGGTVTKSPEQSTYLSGTVVTLTPHANSGFSFSEWSGDCSGSGACLVTMNSDKSVSAAFTANPPPSFTLTINPDDGGTVTKSPEQSTYLSGTVVTLTPHANSGFSFSEWSGDCSGSGACQVIMNSDKEVTAAFAANPPPSFTLTVNMDGGGTVTKSPNQSTYLSGTVVTLTPQANSGFSFSEWSGDCSGSGACQLTMNSNKSVTAIFTQTDTPSNEAPSFTSSPGLTATAGVLYTYALVATDPDSGDALTISAPTKPSWLTLTPTGNGTATLSGTPTSANAGANAVQLSVHDTANATDTQSFVITVVAVDPVDTGAVKGQVVDEEDEGVEGATVTLTPAGEVAAAEALTELTDSEGNYLFEGVLVGDYTLTVIIDGKAPSAPVNVTVQAGQTKTSPTITLQPSKSILHLPILANGK